MKSTSIRLFFIIVALGRVLIAAEKAPLVSITQKNKEADRAYLTWRKESDPALNSILTSDAIIYLANESQLPFDRLVTKKELQNKVRSVTDAFITKFNPTKDPSFKRRTVERLVAKIIMPEYLLQVDPNVRDKTDKVYNDFVSTLGLYKTTAGPFLNVWALRFLTSESQIVALGIIKKMARGNKHFHKLPLQERQRILRSVSDVVVRRFMTNLIPVRKKFGFGVPPHLSMAIKGRINLFLHEKFII